MMSLPVKRPVSLQPPVARIWKIWKKGKLTSEKIRKIWKKRRLDCEKI